MAFTVTSVTGSVNNSHYDIYNSSWSGSNACEVSLYNISKVKVKYTKPSGTSLGRKVTSIDLLVGGSVYKTLTCWGGSWFATCNYLAFQDGDEYELDFRNEGQYFGGNPYGGSSVGSPNTVRFSSSGSKKVQIRLNYKLDSSFDYNDTVTANGSQTIDLGQNVIIDNIYCSSLSINGGTRTFYKGNNFNTTGLSVTANFKYVNSTINGKQATTSTVTSNCTKKAVYDGTYEYNEGSKLDRAGSSGSSGWQVYVTYGGVQAYYDITVYGASLKTAPSISADYKVGASKPTANAVIQYDNGIEETKEVTWTWDNTEGEKSFSWSVSATNTDDTFYNNDNNKLTTTVRDYTLSATYSGSSHYAYNNKGVSSSDLVVKRVWGGTIADETISFGTGSGQYSISYPTWDVGKDSGTVTLTDNDNSATTFFNVNVDGLASMEIDVD